VATARRTYESKEFTIEAIARVLGVSRASIYRHLAGVGKAALSCPLRRRLKIVCLTLRCAPEAGDRHVNLNLCLPLDRLCGREYGPFNGRCRNRVRFQGVCGGIDRHVEQGTSVEFVAVQNRHSDGRGERRGHPDAIGGSAECDPIPSWYLL
jgi:hypothetical protein